MDSDDCEGWCVEEGIGFLDRGGQFQYGIDLGDELDLDSMEELRVAQRTRHNTGTARTSIVLDGLRYVESECDQCGAGSARPVIGQFGVNYQCSGPGCPEKWYHSHCWSCPTGRRRQSRSCNSGLHDLPLADLRDLWSLQQRWVFNESVPSG